MSGQGFDLPPKAPPDVIGQRDALAVEACRALAQAGIPVYRGQLGEEPGGRPGADVHVDSLATGGVLVEWNTQEELATAAADLLESGVDPSDLPHVIRHYETVQTCMRDALLCILASAGFHVEEADMHAYGSAVHVKGYTP
ncbi:hypothetical protein [Streptomyces fulvorobeus]|uniref:Uncharacterized protein n=1 Tax=Streptomyces fulvorobeus TaxID=284028 RepID=A0A7J0CBZ0_9ACTN|nr:hypothetical protein [Streptomyces fulvorobeus]NYE42896.1 hypothetical protein [Streptomyces fulvorobeus]GFM99324.1 hypothetical protein Sfulv_41350 [Streptomyces fulvorobeus]